MAVFGRQKIDPRDGQFYMIPEKLNGRVEVIQPSIDQSTNSHRSNGRDSLRKNYEFLDYNNLKVEGSNKKFKVPAVNNSAKKIIITPPKHSIHKLKIQDPRTSSRNAADQNSEQRYFGMTIDPNMRTSYMKGTIYSNQSSGV